MSELVTWNGTGYTIPTANETGWGTQVTNLLFDLGSNAVSLTGSQTLSNKLLQIQVGAVGTPSVSFVGDTDTGIYQPATGQVAVASNGVQRLLIDNSGNLVVSGVSGTTRLTVSDTVISASVPIAGATYNTGRNYIHNPLFNIAQHGVGPFTTNVFTLDRWFLSVTTDTASVTQSGHNDTSRTAIGDEEAAFALNNVFTGNAAAGAFTAVAQGIENVRRLAGKTVTVSFWAAASSTPKLGVSFDQSFGTGGSPSTGVAGTGQSVTLSTSWATRYSLTFAIPSIIGKTVGTNSDHKTNLIFWYSAGSTNATRSGNVGVQTGNVSIWGIQVELGSVATPLEKPHQMYDLANCQRFYQVGDVVLWADSGASGETLATSLPLPVLMRAKPTMSNSFSSSAGTSSLSVSSVSAATLQLVATTNIIGNVAINGTWTATADI